MLIGASNWLNLVPKGRKESAGTMSWVRRHDESRLQESSVALLDVRPKDEYGLGHLPGVLNIPLREAGDAAR